MNSVKLSVAPFLSLACRNSIRLQQRNDFRFRFQFFWVQPCPDPLTVNDRITVCSTVSSVNALAVIKNLVSIVMAFRTGVERRIHSAKIATSMFGVAGNAGDAGLAMRGNHSSGEAFGLMTCGAVGIHLFLVRHTYPKSMTRSAGSTRRLFGNRRCQSEAVGCMRSR